MLQNYLSSYLPHNALRRIFTPFVRRNLDYGDIIYDKRSDESFIIRIECIQYTVSIIITGALQGTSREHLYQELGLVSLSGSCRF